MPPPMGASLRCHAELWLPSLPCSCLGSYQRRSSYFAALGKVVTGKLPNLQMHDACPDQAEHGCLRVLVPCARLAQGWPKAK